MYYKRGNYQKALENINVAVQAGTKDPVVYYHLGQIYMKQGDQSKARDAFRQALELDPNFEKADEVKPIVGAVN